MRFFCDFLKSVALGRLETPRQTGLGCALRNELMNNFASKSCLCVVFGAALFVRTAAFCAPTADDPAVELPTFTVTDSKLLPQPESWRYARIPGFEILSNSSDRDTQRLLHEFELFTLALNYVWKLPPRPPGAPVELIICGNGRKFDAFRPAGEFAADTTSASLFLGNRERPVIVLDRESAHLSIAAVDHTIGESGPGAFDLNEAGVPGMGRGTDTGLIAVDSDEQFYREYVHFLLSQANPRAPAWLEEGIAQLVMGMKVTRDSIEFGVVEPADLVSDKQALVAMEAKGQEEDSGFMPGDALEDYDFNRALLRRRLLSFEELFAVTHDSSIARNPLGNNRWAKQSWAFVHMCLYGRGKRYQSGLLAYLARSPKEGATEALFTECFKKNYRQMLDELQAYIEVTDYESQEYEAKSGKGFPSLTPVPLREATQSEIGRIKGEAFELANRPGLARNELIAPYIRGERDPQLLAVLGLHERSMGETERARKFLEAAVKLKTDRPRAYYELARLRLEAAEKAPLGGDARLSAEQTEAVLEPLRAGTRLAAPFQENYRLLGEVWARSAARPAKADLSLMEQGVMFFPRDLKLVYQAAFFYAQAGATKEMDHLIQYGSQLTSDPALRAQLAAVAKLAPANR
jgi:hypothetical protein